MQVHACIMYLESEGYMMNRKYFFFDIDGTLAVGTPGDQYIPESTQCTLKQLEAEGYFIAIATGRSYRASQYDHTADDYIKKKLFDRMYHLADGTLVQRDWYSSFLLYCYDCRTRNIDRDRCISEFEKCYSKEKALIKRIETNRIKVLMNSGIKIA